MSCAGTLEMAAALSGVQSATDTAKASNPSVRSSMKLRLVRLSRMMTWAMALSTATSVPGRWRRCSVAKFASSISRGSSRIRRAPNLRTARFISRPMTGWASVVLEPVTNSRSASTMLAMASVIAPEPRVVARPATLLLCQRRAQWSTLCVPTTARASFWTR